MSDLIDTEWGQLLKKQGIYTACPVYVYYALHK